jgi:hypothetical protein
MEYMMKKRQYNSQSGPNKLEEMRKTAYLYSMPSLT